MMKIKNTTIDAVFGADGKIMAYCIVPNDGYAIHTTNYDVPIYDEYGELNGEVLIGFTNGLIQIGYNYNFDMVSPGSYDYIDESGEKNKIEVEKVGKFELFAIPVNVVPKEQLFDGDV